MKNIWKKLTVAIAFVGLMIGTTACGKTDEVKEDLYTYLTSMTEVQELQKTAINEYNAYITDTDADSQQLLAALKDSIIPTYEEYVANVNAVASVTPEVQALKTTCVAAADKQLEALNKIAEAIEACDADMLNEADALIAEAETKFDEYTRQLETLAAEHEITLIQQGSGVEQENQSSEEPAAE